MINSRTLHAFSILVPFLSLITLIEPRNFHLGPVVDPGVFVITHIRSCRNGAGYCILGFSCEIDNDFEADDLGGHCRGLSAAFNPVASFVCCKENPTTVEKNEHNHQLEVAIAALNNGELSKFNLSFPSSTSTSSPSTTTILTTPLSTTTTTTTTTTEDNSKESITTEQMLPEEESEEDMTISVVNTKLDFEHDSTLPSIITSSTDTILISSTEDLLTTNEAETTSSSTSTSSLPSTAALPSDTSTTDTTTTTTVSTTEASIIATTTLTPSIDRPFERRLVSEEKCGVLGGQAVFQAFGRAAANFLPDLVASWVTGKTSSSSSQHRVNNKDEAKVTSTVIYCWLTAIVDLETDKLICTGTLVRNDLVMTTASCSSKIMSRGIEKYKVVAGDSNLMINLPFGVQERPIKKVEVHPDFGLLTKENDIGIIQINKDMELTETVCLLCLPQSDKKSYKESNCTITGYGRAIRNEIPTEVTDGILRTTVLSILERDECNRNAPVSTESPDNIQSSYRSLQGTVCLGEKRSHNTMAKDNCFIALDTGSPLSCQNEDGSFELAGVLSSGTTCSRDQSIFVDVSKYMNWILNLL
nr:uncharacterized protein LOC121114404 [Lepeophtheirus salmonis]